MDMNDYFLCQEGEGQNQFSAAAGNTWPGGAIDPRYRKEGHACDREDAVAPSARIGVLMDILEEVFIAIHRPRVRSRRKRTNF